jgi:hypothetical protein
MESHLIIPPDSDFFLTKHELKPLYDNLIIQYLMQIGQPELGFEAWYAQLDRWDRRIIQASHLKEYLIGLNYTSWEEISMLIPGLELEKVAESPKLNQVLNQ